MLCEKSSKKLKIVRFCSTESVRELLRLDVFLGSLLLVSVASNMHS